MADAGFPVDQLAALLDVTPRRLQQLATEGWFARPERGRYQLVATVQGYIRYLKEGSKNQQRGSEQARLARAQAVKVEMENFRRMGELITREQSDATNQGLVVLIKSSHEGLPGRLSSQLAAMTEPSDVYRSLQTESRAILNQCFDYLEKRAASLEAMPEPGAHHQAEREEEADDVGGLEPEDAGGQP